MACPLFVFVLLAVGAVAERLEEKLLQAARRLPALHSGSRGVRWRHLAVRHGRLEADASSAAMDPVSAVGAGCILLDVYSAQRLPEGPGSGRKPPVVHIDSASLQSSPYSACRFRILWAKGRGLALDWMPQEPRLCDLYNALLVEDEFLMDKWRESPPSCRVYPLDPHEVSQPSSLGRIPWEPGGKLPLISQPLVSFHTYTVYDEEAHTNPQRWLSDPDVWNPYFIGLAREGFLRLCMKREECLDDDAPYRLMFWEDISKEFLNCLARGITPVYHATPAVHEYVDRNILLVPYQFQAPLEMQALVQTLSSPEGVLEYGTKVYMQRQSNYILSSLYWRQSVSVRALLAVSAAWKQRALLSALSSTPSNQPVAELVVCVTSTASNRAQRDVIRQTWGRERLLRTAAGFVNLRVLFFLGAQKGAQQEANDVVHLPLEEAFGRIWVKTAAILKFGSDYFQGKLGAEGLGHEGLGREGQLRFLIKCDDDAFIDIDAVALDLLQVSPVGLYWGHVMALVEPNRVEGDKYFVSKEVYPFEYYPPYARGMAYALSEDLVIPLGQALGEASIDPFPYREDVSVGLYLHQLAQRGEVRVVPQQRKDSMPLDINEHCAGRGLPPTVRETGPRTLLVLHRFHPGNAPCFWGKIEARRRGQTPPAGDRSVLDFCSCVQP